MPTKAWSGTVTEVKFCRPFGDGLKNPSKSQKKKKNTVLFADYRHCSTIWRSKKSDNSNSMVKHVAHHADNQWTSLVSKWYPPEEKATTRYILVRACDRNVGSDKGQCARTRPGTTAFDVWLYRNNIEIIMEMAANQVAGAKGRGCNCFSAKNLPFNPTVLVILRGFTIW